MHQTVSVTDDDDLAGAAAQAPVMMAAWRFLEPFYEDKDLDAAWPHMDPRLCLCWAQWWAEANQTALQAAGFDAKAVARALAQAGAGHRLWPDFERVIIRDFQAAHPLDPQRWGIGVAPRVVGPDVELLYVHRDLPAGVIWAPGASAEVVPVVMGLTEGLWRVLNLGGEVIPEPGWPPRLD